MKNMCKIILQHMRNKVINDLQLLVIVYIFVFSSSQLQFISNSSRAAGIGTRYSKVLYISHSIIIQLTVINVCIKLNTDIYFFVHIQ